ncbi:hypothetical protein ACFW1A_00640 [Kitasatospora sp. NPDC058965]|uniref:hypothetical protein n=1 Tax=Kitasatospora sp. NPDC058965 TaxID=3346682 RepID=UPI0036A08B82
MGAFDDDQGDGNEPSTGLLPDVVLPNQTARQVVVKPLPGTAIDLIPAPYKPLGTGALSAKEEADLEACEAGIQNLQNAFWIAGKSLDTIKEAELHREKHSNFADYVQDRWDISESQAHRLVDAWRLGERIAKLGLKPRESQVREIVPVSKTKGMETAVALYDAASQEYGRVTAKILKDLVEALPDGPLPSPQVGKFVREVKTRQDVQPEVHVITARAADSPIGESASRATEPAPDTADASARTGGTATATQGQARPVADATADSATGRGAYAPGRDAEGTASSVNTGLVLILDLLKNAEGELVRIQPRLLEADPSETGGLLAEIEGRATLIAQAAQQLNI